MYGTGSHPAQLSSYAHACGLMPRNLFLKCGILRALRMGHVKRTLALVFGLAAVLLFAPIARADFPGGKSPYRDLAPLSHAPGVTPADGGDEHGDDGAHDGSHAGDGSASSDKHNDTDDDEACDAQDHDDDQGDDHDGQDAPAQAPAQAQGHDADDGDEGCPGDTGNQPGSNPGTNPGTGDQGPSTQSVPSGMSPWLWLLLIVIAGAATSTAYVLRRRMKAR